MSSAPRGDLLAVFASIADPRGRQFKVGEIAMHKVHPTDNNYPSPLEILSLGDGAKNNYLVLLWDVYRDSPGVLPARNVNAFYDVN